MTFRLGLKSLAAFGHQMSTMLDAGIPVSRALVVLGRSANARLKGMYRRLNDRIANGDVLSEAMTKEGRAFPRLCLRLVEVGEVSGGLPAVLKRLGEYYQFIRSMWGRLLGGLVWPLFEYCALVGVLALVTYIASMIGIDVGLNFTPRQVILVGVGVFLAPIVLYFLVSRTVEGMRVAHEILLRIPVIGHLMRTIALARFSWAMELMTEAGVPILNAVMWSMETTTNGAFIGRGRRICKQLEEGETMADAFRRSGLFPVEYVEMIAVAQESGSMPDMFGRLARNYFEKMELAMRALTRLIGILVWMIVAAVIIYFIFRLFNHIYGGMHDLAPEVY